MHHFVTEMCTHVHISVTKWCIVGYDTDAFWDLWDGSIASHINLQMQLLSHARTIVNLLLHRVRHNPDSKVHGAHLGPMLAPWTLLSGKDYAQDSNHIILWGGTDWFTHTTQDLYSLSGMSYHQISWSPEAARSDVWSIALKYDGHLGSVGAEVPVKFQNDSKSLNQNLAAFESSRDLAVRRLTVYWIETQDCSTGRVNFAITLVPWKHRIRKIIDRYIPDICLKQWYINHTKTIS